MSKLSEDPLAVTIPIMANCSPNFNWGDTDIRLVQEKLLDLESKFGSFSRLPVAFGSLSGRVDLLEGKLNMMKTEIQQLSSNLLSWRNNQGSEPHFSGGGFNSGQGLSTDWNPSEVSEEAETTIDDLSRSVNAIIKEEMSYEDEDYGFNDDDWQQPTDNEDPLGPGRTPSVKKAPDHSHSFRIIRRRVGRVPRHGVDADADEPSSSSDAKELHLSNQSDPTGDNSGDIPDKIIITPNVALMEKSKELLGPVKCDEVTGKFLCPVCTKPFNYKKDLVRHHYVHSGMKPYQCTSCPMSFSRGDKLIKHIQVRHLDEMKQGAGTSKRPAGSDQLPFYCPVCNKNFSNARNFAQHNLIHSTNRETFPCSDCEKVYSRRTKLREHYRQKHSPDGMPVVVEPIKVPPPLVQMEIKKSVSLACPDCGRVFGKKSKLDCHLISCRGLKPFRCGECDSSFGQKSALIQHRACVHQKVKRFLCSDCGRSFYGSASYKRHVRAHNGLKPFPCKHCGRCFAGQSDVKRHEVIHTGIRNLQCPHPHCDLKFYRPYTLKRHLLVHTGEKPYMCDLCGANFSQSGSLKKHKECHDRGGFAGSGRCGKSPEDHRKTRVGSKPWESRPRLMKQQLLHGETELRRDTSGESLRVPVPDYFQQGYSGGSGTSSGSGFDQKEFSSQGHCVGVDVDQHHFRPQNYPTEPQLSTEFSPVFAQTRYSGF